jgi:hypothetical protein
VTINSNMYDSDFSITSSLWFISSLQWV